MTADHDLVTRVQRGHASTLPARIHRLTVRERAALAAIHAAADAVVDLTDETRAPVPA